MTPTKRLTIALVFVAIAAVIFVVVKNVDFTGGGEETGTPTSIAPLFPDAQSGDLTKLQVKENATGKVVAVEKQGDGTWTILKAPAGSDTGLGVDQERITNAISLLPTAQPSRILTEIEELTIYGLGDATKYTIDLTIGGKNYTLSVGSKNPGDLDYYVQKPDSPDLYLISTFYLDPIIELLTTPPYIQPTPNPNVTPSVTPTTSSTNG